MFLSILFILLITFGIGLPLVLLIAPKANTFIKLGLSFPIGIGIFTLLMFGANLLGLRFTLLNELLLLLVISTPLVLIQLKKIKLLFKEIKKRIKNSKFDLAEKIILGISAFLIVVSFINTFYWPVYMWDSVVLYDFRGHVFASTGFMKDVFINPYYYSYPLLTSLTHTIVYLCGGKYPQFIYSIFYLSLGISFYGLLREFVSRKTGLIFTLLLLMTGPLFYHSLYSYTNLTYTVYLSLGAILIYLWDKKGNIGYLILSALMVGLSTWVRATEPFWLASILIVVVISILRKKILGLFIYPLIVVLIHEVWRNYRIFLASTSKSTVAEVASYTGILPSIFDLERWRQIIVYLYKYTIIPWGSIFIAFILALVVIIFQKKLKKFWLVFTITIVFLAVVVLGTLYYSLTFIDWYRIGDAVERLSMIFYPLFVYSSFLVLYDLGSKEKHD